MILKRTSLSRRKVLRGAGATLALPLLEAMQVNSFSKTNENAKPPVRAGFFYIPNGVVQTAWHPKDTGPGYELSPTLEPIRPIKNDVTLFTKLDRIKVAGTDGHAQAGACWLSSAAPDELSPAGYPLKKTIDQIMAEHTGKETAFRSLELSCNPYEDNRESVYFDNISWYGHGHVARSLRDPKAVFNRLFGVKQHLESGSVLDLVMDDAKSLNHNLGRTDKGKLGEYMDSVRTVEQQIERVTKRQEDINKLKILLANETTAILHGSKAAKESEETAKTTFVQGGIGKNIPEKKISKESISKGINILDLIFESGLASSKSDARRILKNRGIKINDEVVVDEKKVVNLKEFSKNNYIKLSVGKKTHLKVTAT